MPDQPGLTLDHMIDPMSPKPLFMQLADVIAARIGSGEYAAGQRLPGVDWWHQDTGLARGTILHAMRELQSRGLVVILPGRGTYVVNR
jgi:GntR family transcriptional regulator